MKQNLIHIGLAVADKQYHGSAMYQTTGEVLDSVQIRICVSNSKKIEFKNAITILLIQAREPTDLPHFDRRSVTDGSGELCRVSAKRENSPGAPWIAENDERLRAPSVSSLEFVDLWPDQRNYSRYRGSCRTAAVDHTR
jgi:hypothetical protein